MRLKVWQVVFVGCLVLVGTTGLAGTGPAEERAPGAGDRLLAAMPVPAANGAQAFHAPMGEGFPHRAVGAPARTSFAPGTLASAKTTPSSTASTAEVAEVQPRIQKTGDVVLVVPARQVGVDLRRVSGLATGNGGFVLNSGTQAATAGEPAQATATLQVPVGDFETVLSQVEQVGHVSSLSTKANDLTGQYVDLQAQLQALEASRQQYLTIMAKAKSIGDVLAVQEQLDGIDSQIQQLQGEQQLMVDETTYSTINVTITQKTSIPPRRPAASGMQKAWDGAVSGFVTGVEGVVRLAGPIAFVLLLVAAFAFMGRWVWRWRRPAGKTPAALGPPDNS